MEVACHHRPMTACERGAHVCVCVCAPCECRSKGWRAEFENALCSFARRMSSLYAVAMITDCAQEEQGGASIVEGSAAFDHQIEQMLYG
jgi:hypothetical protein